MSADKAVIAAADEIEHAIETGHGFDVVAEMALTRAADPGLGLDRYVCLRDIHDFLKAGAPTAAKWVREEFAPGVGPRG